MAASLGFEPRQRDSESLVLPLHYEASERENRDLCRLSQVARNLRNDYAAAIFFASRKISVPCCAPVTSRWLPLFIASSRADFSILSIIASS